MKNTDDTDPTRAVELSTEAQALNQNKLDIIKNKFHMYLINSFNEAEISSMIEIIKNIREKTTTSFLMVGFDSEFHEDNTIALLQLSFYNNDELNTGIAFIIRFYDNRSGKYIYHNNIPQIFTDIFIDKNIIKVGVGLKNDIDNIMTSFYSNNKLYGDIQKQFKESTFDIQNFYQWTRVNNPNPLSFVALTKIYCDIDISSIKRSTITTSKWAEYNLSDEQKNYAFFDTIICLEIAKKINVLTNYDNYRELARAHELARQARKQLQAPAEKDKTAKAPDPQKEIEIAEAKQRTKLKNFLQEQEINQRRINVLAHTLTQTAPDGTKYTKVQKELARADVQIGLLRSQSGLQEIEPLLSYGAAPAALAQPISVELEDVETYARLLRRILKEIPPDGTAETAILHEHSLVNLPTMSQLRSVRESQVRAEEKVQRLMQETPIGEEPLTRAQAVAQARELRNVQKRHAKAPAQTPMQVQTQTQAHSQAPVQAPEQTLMQAQTQTPPPHKHEHMPGTW